ncbi:hypothetical protein AXG93_215s1030 [Marchantia polymorpha subsp. ruderalis]|nr:hypothetical protein AXG93_215s1030 [Marchantia polymorpha subsp. ruderalis]
MDIDEDSYALDPPPYVPVEHIWNDSEFWKRYSFVGRIDTGPFAGCTAVVKKGNPGKKYALQIDSKIDRFGFNADSRQCLRLFRKCVVLNRILPKHKNINAMDHMVFSQTSLFMLQDMCEGFLEITHFYPQATDLSARALFIQLADAVQFMHDYGVVHGNLISKNILFYMKPFTDPVYCKITGFDLAVHYHYLANKFKRNFHEADYLYDHHLSHHSQMPYTKAGDVRDLGKILYQMLVNNADPDNIPASGPDFKPWVRDAAMHLLRMIGPRGFGPHKDEDLLEIDGVLRHPWLKLLPPNPGLANVKELERLMVKYHSDWSVIERILVNPRIPFKYMRAEVDLRLWYVNKRTTWLGNRNLDLVENRDHPERVCEIRILRRVSPAGSSSRAKPVNALALYNELMVNLKILPPHPSIVDLEDVFINKDFIMILRRCEDYSTLEDFIKFATEDRARRCFRQLVHAIRHMHSYGVVHMGLHCDNIVFSEDDSDLDWRRDWRRPKLINITEAFWIPGLATNTIPNFDPASLVTPEQILMANQAYCTAEKDIRDLGRILFSILYGKWLDMDQIRGMPLTAEQLRPGRFSDNALDLLRWIGPYPFGPQDFVPLMTIDELCAHPWVMEDLPV